MKNLNSKAFGGLAFLIIVMALVLFLPAGTFNYWQAWVFLTVFGSATLAVTLYLMKNDPKLLERRVNAGPGAEKETTQKIIQSIASIAFILVIVFPAVDYRFGWSNIPPYISIIGDIFVGLGLFIVFLVFKENSFTSGTIEVEANQKVISTGPYAFIRHPMYAGAFIMLIGVPLALGSFWGLLIIIPLVSVIIWRLLDEEKILKKNLSGYLEYQKKVNYRLIPHIW